MVCIHSTCPDEIPGRILYENNIRHKVYSCVCDCQTAPWPPSCICPKVRRQFGGLASAAAAHTFTTTEPRLMWMNESGKCKNSDQICPQIVRLSSDSNLASRKTNWSPDRAKYKHMESFSSYFSFCSGRWWQRRPNQDVDKDFCCYLSGEWKTWAGLQSRPARLLMLYMPSSSRPSRTRAQGL